MKLLQWECIDGIKAYTTCAYDNEKVMNMAFLNRNDKDVLKNREELAKMLNTDLTHMVAPMQKHTTNFKEVSLKDGGKGMYTIDDAFEGYDALYTKDKDLWLCSFHADCTPVMIYCQDKQIVAAIHSGWKGTVTEIVTKVVKHLIDNEKCNPKQIYAYIGPSIEKDNFEARDDIIHLVNQMSFDTSSYYTKKDETSYLLNHKGLIKQQLLNLGILEQNITVSPYCTIKNEELFFSYRKDKTPHRHITCISLK